jgi:hypothetical protein
MQPQPDEEQGEQPGAPDETEGTEQPGQPQPGGQQDFERVVIAGMKAIYAEGVSEQLIQMMQKAQNPAQGLATATALIMGELVRQSQGSMPPQVVQPAMMDIMRFIGELAEAAKILDSTPQLIQQALPMAAQMLQQAQQQGAQAQAQPGGAQPQPQMPPAAAQPQPQPTGY